MRTRKTPLKGRDGHVTSVLTSSVETACQDVATSNAVRQLRAIASNASANFADGKVLREQVHSLILEKVATQEKLAFIDAQQGNKKGVPSTPSSATKSRGRFSMGATPKNTPKK